MVCLASHAQRTAPSVKPVRSSHVGAVVMCDALHETRKRELVHCSGQANVLCSVAGALLLLAVRVPLVAGPDLILANVSWPVELPPVKIPEAVHAPLLPWCSGDVGYFTSKLVGASLAFCMRL